IWMSQSRALGPRASSRAPWSRVEEVRAWRRAVPAGFCAFSESRSAELERRHAKDTREIDGGRIPSVHARRLEYGLHSVALGEAQRFRVGLGHVEKQRPAAGAGGERQEDRIGDRLVVGEERPDLVAPLAGADGAEAEQRAVALRGDGGTGQRAQPQAQER